MEKDSVYLAVPGFLVAYVVICHVFPQVGYDELSVGPAIQDLINILHSKSLIVNG